jgi:hypothetical protein
MVPGAGLLGTSGVESGKAAPLVGGPPGVELHTVVDELPSGDAGAIVPVVLPMIDVGMVPNAVPDVIAVDAVIVANAVIAAALPVVDVEVGPGTVDGVGVGVAVEEVEDAPMADDDTGTVEPGKSDINEDAGCADSTSGAAVADVEAGTAAIVGAAEIKGAIPIPLPVVELMDTVGVPGAICPVGVEQVTTVPGVVGSEASGTGASVVPGAPGWVVAENGLGPLIGDVTIVPGVVERPMAVLPMVETCARLALQPASKIAVVNSKRRIATPPSAPI